MSTDAELDFAPLLERFGLTEFRPGQREVISAVLGGHDCLCIMPTGGGKSLCYQLPSIARDGLTLVVSPLIALMKDQVDSLQSHGIRAACINSSISFDEQQARMEQMANGGFDLVYIAPERLRNHRFLEALSSARVGLLAVDEAHCISEWGHDFRPDYARLGAFRERLGRPATIALTATATPLVRDDIVKSLGLHEPQTFVTGFARPNLHFDVWPTGGGRDKDEALLQFLADNPGSGIIYSSTRKRCEELVEMLGMAIDRRVGLYHAGLIPEQRRQVQEAFMAGDLPIIVATNAFGMGIDKSDLRFVVHFNMPGTLEAYYQEAGRAGRDGRRSRCLMLYNYSDRKVQEFFIESAYPPAETVRAVYEYLASLHDDPIELTLQELKETLGLSISSEGIGTCERLLEKSGVIERLDTSENMASVRIDIDTADLVELLPRDAKKQRRVIKALERVVGERRGERVFFSWRALQHNTEMDRDALQRALRELAKLDWFDYVPPFRGRAVHFRRRGVPFEQLEIDFAQLDERRALEYAKLDEVVAYAGTRRCRQATILNYFGDRSLVRCGMCDNCRAAGAIEERRIVASAAATSDATPNAAGEENPSAALFPAPVVELVRITLSGVARCRQRVGKQLVAQMLCGSNSAKIKSLGLQKLSTHGLLKYLTQQEVCKTLDRLIESGLVEQTETQKFRPIIGLTETGADVMRGASPVPHWFRPPKSVVEKTMGRAAVSTPMSTTSPSAPKPAAPTAEKAERNSPGTAARDEKHRAESMPRDEGNSKPIDTVDFDSVDVDSGDVDSGDVARIESPHVASAHTANRDPGARPTHHWTWALLVRGFTPREAEMIRGLDAASVLDHIVRAAEEGLPVRSDWFLTEAQRRATLRALAAADPDDVRAGRVELPKTIMPQHLRLVILERENEQV